MPSQSQRASSIQQGSFSFAPLAVLVLAQVGTTGDNAAMNLAVSSLSAQLGATLGDIQLANTVYALVAGALMLAGGLLGALFGWRRTMRFGLVFAVGGELCAALAPTMAVLVWCGRLLLGLGASLVTPAVLGLVAALYEGRRRAVAFGAIAGAAALSTLSPLVLGLLMDASGFRVSFGVLALYFVAVLACTVALPRLERAAERPRLDLIGIVLAPAGLGLFMMGISWLPSWGVLKPQPGCPFTLFGLSPCLPMALSGLAVLAVLVPLELRGERRRGSALIPASFVKSPAVRAGVSAVALPFFFMGAQGIVIMPYLQLIVGLTAAQAGLFSLLSGVPMFVLASALPRLAPRLSSRRTIRAGFGMLVLSCLVMAAGIVPGGISPLLYAGVFLGGLGVGAVNSQANNAVASAVAGGDAPQSGGIQGAARNVGMAMGTAIAGTSLLLALGLGLGASLPAGSLPDEARLSVLQQGSSIMADQAFEDLVEPSGLTAADLQTALDAKRSAQTEAERLAFAAVALVMAAGLVSTRRLVETAAAPAGGRKQGLMWPRK